MSKGMPGQGGTIRVIGRILAVLGVLVLAAGVATWFGVRAALVAENIEVSGDTPFMSSAFGAGEGEAPQAVDGPLSALAQAEAIKAHTAHTPGGFGFEELDGATAAEIAHARQAKDYPGAGAKEADARMDALWGMMNTASFLRSSLMLSALAFGVALLVSGIGVTITLAGLALLSAGKDIDEVARRVARPNGLLRAAAGEPGRARVPAAV
jgi:hypothetical protein